MSLKEIAQTTLGLIDLTTLNDDDTDTTVITLCEKASTKFGNVPAICIYKQFIPTAKKYFADHNLDIKIATVTNFPHGNDNLEIASRETQEAVDLGADEIDIVFPYKALIAGNLDIGATMIKAAKKICGTKKLKVIIESGELQTPELIKLASDISIANGADFIKTSTGKVKINATLEATKIMLTSIKNSGNNCSFKAAGGVKFVREAKEYIDLTTDIMGKNWINSDNFRFGASSLLTDVINVLEDKECTSDSSKY